MTPHRLENYLRSYRNNSGLTQREVGFLLGRKSGAQASTYEKRHRLPPLECALACEKIFGVYVGELSAAYDRRSAETLKNGAWN
jgi:hypothetical protein